MDMRQLKGYQQHIRGNGSYWYLCDYCEAIAHVTNNEQEMIEHVNSVHKEVV